MNVKREIVNRKVVEMFPAFFSIMVYIFISSGHTGKLNCRWFLFKRATLVGFLMNIFFDTDSRIHSYL